MKTYLTFNLIAFLSSCICLKNFLHIYQLKSYDTRRYLAHFKQKKSLFFLICFFAFIIEFIFSNILLYGIINAILIMVYIIFCKNLIKTSKTPIKFTGKLSRIYVFSIFILLILFPYKLGCLAILLSSLFVPIIANTLNLYDSIKNKFYIHSAQKKLRNTNCKIIAITGSNGKTSVKNILLKLISAEHKAQATPASFNTPIGIAKFINQELKHDTKFLILEYGARRKNDIKILCKTFGADYGIITTISAQHLQTFKSLENVFKAKNALSVFLENKPCVYNIDNLFCLRAFQEKNHNFLSASIFGHANIFASNITVSNKKTCFNLHINNIIYPAETNLLGKHNVSNICLACALANEIGIETEKIIGIISTLQPTPHRLELVQTHINILDDSYNCSPSSASEAVEVLKSFPGKKMVVTPGIIECGKQKDIINFYLGNKLAIFDYCIIVGNENKVAISDGIKKAVSNNPKLQIKTIFANNLDEAKQYFKILNKNDTLLLLNDLPDDYT